MISILLTPFGGRLILCIRFTASFVRKNLNNCWAKITGHLRETRDIILGDIGVSTEDPLRIPAGLRPITASPHFDGDLRIYKIIIHFIRNRCC